MIKIVMDDKHDALTDSNRVSNLEEKTAIRVPHSCSDDQQITIKLNNLIQGILADNGSDLGREMKVHLSEGKPVPKRLIYAALKQALDEIDPSKSVLITDRNISQPHPDQSVPNGSLHHLGTSSQKVPDLSTRISAMTVSNQQPVERTPIDNVGDADGFSKLVSKLKHTLCPPRNGNSVKEAESGSNFILRYFKKMKGGQTRPPRESSLEALQSFIVSFVGILVLTSIDYFFLIDTPYTLMIGSFGATAVLLFCAIKSPLAQPRNVLAGNVLSAFIGVGCQYFLGQKFPWLAAALAVSLSIAAMSLTNTVHPPGGATALIAVYSNQKIHDLSLLYVLIPVATGATILVLVAIIMNNMFPSRRYPVYWK